MEVEQTDSLTDWAVKLPFEKFTALMEKARFYECLKSCGVDNWEGYVEASRKYRSNEEITVIGN